MSQLPPGQPMYQMQPAPKPAGMAIASMVLGIVSVVIFCVWYLSIPCAILAIILGAVAKGRATRGEGGGGGMAKAGVVLGIVSIVLIVLITILAVVGISMFGSTWAQKMQQMQQQQMQNMQNQPAGTGTGTASPTPGTPDSTAAGQNGQKNPLGNP